MSRPKRKRKVCCLPENNEFRPVRGNGDSDMVFMTLDEYETIRLIDHEGFTQMECARFMGVARTTIQEIYESARKKLSDALVEFRPLRIEGGEYSLCDGAEHFCRCGGCEKHRMYNGILMEGDTQNMKVAVTYDNGEIFQHFGHTEFFKLYEIQNGAVVSSEVVSTNGSGHGALAQFLYDHQVDTLICGGIGGGAQNALAQAGIRLLGGVSGKADDAVAALLANVLDYNPDVRCNHHGHGGEDHTCGSHGCGHSHCGE